MVAAGAGRAIAYVRSCPQGGAGRADRGSEDFWAAICGRVARGVEASPREEGGARMFGELVGAVLQII
jgi:hypothetical protein